MERSIKCINVTFTDRRGNTRHLLHTNGGLGYSEQEFHEYMAKQKKLCAKNGGTIEDYEIIYK